MDRPHRQAQDRPTLDPTHASAETRRLNPHIYGQVVRVDGGLIDYERPAKDVAPKPVKPKKEKMPNQTEREYGLMLERQFGFLGARVCYEAYKLKIAVGCWYIPDWAVEFSDGRVEFFEVKGAHVFSKALTKPRAAAEMYPQRFTLAQKARKRDGGRWTVSELPGRATRMQTQPT